MKKLSLVDKGFLLSENKDTPMHVAGISLYTLPKGANEQEFLHELAETLRTSETLLPPFGDRLHTGRLGLAGATYWERDPELDMDYHVRHSALPKPGRYRELFNLVSRLHGTLLDRSRPLWEMHLIEGLQDRQFAVYSKTHHAAVDGARSVHISRSMLSSDPKHVMAESPLSLQSWERYKAALTMGKPPEYSQGDLRNVSDMLKSSFDSSANIFRAVQGFADAWRGEGELSLPHLKVPRSSLNTEINGSRRFVAQSWPFARIRAMAKAMGGTFNDAVLAMCAGALRQYLQTHAELPKHSLKAMVPVSLRQEGDLESGNAVATISADLATNITDPAERFETIRASVQAGKQYYSEMTPSEVEMVSLIMQTPALLLMPMGLISHLPPYNVTISNVPGIRETMYWNGAKLTGSYPLSIVTDGMAMNITLVTNADNVDFGIIACRRSVPQVQRIIDYMELALLELEQAAGLPNAERKSKAPAKRKSQAQRKTPAKSKTGARTKVKAKAKTKTKATNK